MKLTKAQRELLASLPTNCVDYYAPRKRLIEVGLAEAGAGSRLNITDLGRSALTQTDREGKPK